MRRRLFLMSLATVGLAACMQNPVIDPVRALAEAKAAPRIKVELRENIAELYCFQPGWQKCSGKSESQCFSDINALREPCARHAEMASNSGDTGKQLFDFQMDFLRCIDDRLPKPEGFSQCFRFEALDSMLVKTWMEKRILPIKLQARLEAEAEIKAQKEPALSQSNLPIK